MKDKANTIKQKLQSVINEDNFTPLHAPIFEGNEIKDVIRPNTRCLQKYAKLCL